METSIFIPKKIHVGFQTRHDTYTKKLAYIIYEDEKVSYENKNLGMVGVTKV